MTKRQITKKAAVARPTTEDGLADKVAIAVGSTLGRLVNRKNALLAQLSQVEEKIADVSRRAGEQIEAHLPAGLRSLKRARKAKRPAMKPRTPRKTVTPVAPHGRDQATLEAKRAAKATSARARRVAAPTPAAARATRRG